MFNFLKGKKHELIVMLDRPDGVYHPGEVVNLNVDIQPRNSLELVGVRVILRGVEGMHSTALIGTKKQMTAYP